MGAGGCSRSGGDPWAPRGQAPAALPVHSLHGDAELHRVLGLRHAGPHRQHEEVGAEDPQLGAAQLEQRVPAGRGRPSTTGRRPDDHRPRPRPSPAAQPRSHSPPAARRHGRGPARKRPRHGGAPALALCWSGGATRVVFVFLFIFFFWGGGLHLIGPWRGQPGLAVATRGCGARGALGTGQGAGIVAAKWRR